MTTITLPLTEAARRVLDLLTGKLRHRYMGDCPSHSAPDATDPACSACHAITALRAALEQPQADHSEDALNMVRGTRGDGTPWHGTAAECIADARQAASVEAGIADEMRSHVVALEALLAEARGTLVQLAAVYDAMGNPRGPKRILTDATVERIDAALGGKNGN